MLVTVIELGDGALSDIIGATSSGPARLIWMLNPSPVLIRRLRSKCIEYIALPCRLGTTSRAPNRPYCPGSTGKINITT